MKEGKICTFFADTPLGKMQAAASDKADPRSAALCGLWFVGQKYFPQSTETWIEKPDYPVFVLLRTWLKEYFSGRKPETKLPLLPDGTDFQKAVWNLLLEIPYGKTSTYGVIAARLVSRDKKAPAQAVGGAVGHNPISLLIPCHRVLGADGSLTGYAGGLEKKRALLELEKAPISTAARGKPLRP